MMPAVADAEPEDPLVGATLAETYRVERRIAEGGMGRLYEALHVRVGIKLAIKALRPSSGPRAAAIERVRREARAMASIDSPHVVRVHDVVPGLDGMPCIVTELLEGEDLGARLARERKLPVPDAVRIIRAVASGLAEAHRRGVLHRDVKPSNVFLTRDGGVKLIDFGVAKLEEAAATLTHAGAFLGTPAYMAREQAAAASKADERSDIYSLGAVLYHALSGQPPYGDLDATQTLGHLLRGEPPRLSAMSATVPEALVAIVEKAMARDPVDRFATADAFAAALAPFEAGGPAPDAEQAARWLRPRAAGSVLVASLLLSLWSAAMCAQIAAALELAASWPEWALVLYRAVPGVVLVLASISGARSLAARWRSAPRVRALADGLRRAVWTTAAALGAVTTIEAACRLYPEQLGAQLLEVSARELALGSLSGSLLLGASVAAIMARLSRSLD